MLDARTLTRLERIFDLQMMKGSAWPGNAQLGVVHRSPPVTDAPRLMLTINGRP